MSDLMNELVDLAADTAAEEPQVEVRLDLLVRGRRRAVPAPHRAPHRRVRRAGHRRRCGRGGWSGPSPTWSTTPPSGVRRTGRSTSCSPAGGSRSATRAGRARRRQGTHLRSILPLRHRPVHPRVGARALHRQAGRRGARRGRVRRGRRRRWRVVGIRAAGALSGFSPDSQPPSSGFQSWTVDSGRTRQ